MGASGPVLTRVAVLARTPGFPCSLTTSSPARPPRPSYRRVPYTSAAVLLAPWVATSLLMGYSEPAVSRDYNPGPH